jgi:DNA-binding transcriptional LysR family regulator
MAQCLLDAGLLTDLDIEVPVDRHWARLMKVEFGRAAELASRAPAAPPVPEPFRLAANPVPPAWANSVKRLQQAMRRHGKSVTDTDAMLAWAIHTRAIAIIPKPLPPSLGAIHDLIAPLVEPTRTEKE